MDFVNATIKLIYENYKKEIDDGIIDIIVPPSDYYPDLNKVDVKDELFNDPLDRIKWRTKQNYDISYLMNYCFTRGQYYLQVKLKSFYR
jgi:alpha-1,3-mannosylglycoprotein beta-1,4-N-acetylglucosaminyltransferase A/B